MRLSWLTALRPGQLRNPLRGVGRRRRGPKTVPLRVRQLERRRVLDGAIQSAVVSTLLTDVGQSSQTANSNPSPATGSQSNVQAPSANSASGNTAYSAAIAQGSILNIPPVLVVATDQTSHEGQLLDLSGTGGAPPLGLFVDPDLGDSHTATVNWGDSLAIENATIIGGVGAGALGGTHTYADDGVYTVTVKVFDNNGGSDTKSFNVMVQNVPPVLVTAPDQTVAEGHLLDLSGTGGAPPLGLFVDPGLLDTHTATVNWGDGSTTENATIIPGVGAGALGGTHKYAEDGTYTVTVKVMDNDGGSDTRTFDVTVKDVTPGVALNPVPDINENGIVTLTGTYTDPGIQDSQTLTVHWDDPNKSSASTFAIGAIQNSAGMSTLSVGQLFNSSTDSAVLTITSINSSTGDVGFSVQHRYLDDGLAPGNGTISDTSTVMVTVKDDDGQTGSSTTMVTVSNVTPSVVLNAVSDINENGFATLLGSFTDIGLLDAHTLIINWADPNNASASTFTISAIENAAEMATLHVGDTFASSTDSVVLKITSIDTLTGQVGFTSQHQYLDDGLAPGNGTVSDISTIGVSVTDDDTQAGSNTTMVAIHNVAPSIVVGPVSDINENGVATLTGNYTDIGLLDAHTLTINWDDPNNASASTFTINAVENAAGTATLHFGDTFSSSTDNAVLTIESINSATGEVGFSVKHQYLDDGLAPGNNTTSDTSTISATVADDDGQSGSNTTMVTVHNVAPTILNLTGDTIDEGKVATITLNVGDPGTLDVFTVNVDWKDGSTATITGLGLTNAMDTTGTTLYTWTAATRQLTLTHLYSDNADYQVAVKVADDDMSADFAGAASDANFVQQSTIVHVANVPPSLAGTTDLTVDEGGAVTLAGLGVHIADPGFDNPANQTSTTPGNLTTEDFAAFSIDWGDNSPTEITMPINVVNRVSGSLASDATSASLTTADFMHDPHYYADDGTYTVTVRIADDNMGAFNNPALFQSGVAGVDYVDRTFQIVVKNVTPTLAVDNVASQQQTGSPVVTTSPITPGTTITINESGTVSLAASFTDPGFSLDPNPASPSSADLPRNEVFRYYINWGDNRETIGEIAAADVANLINGGPTVLTTGAFDTAGMIHTYADDGTYKVVVRLADDNMGAFADTAKFATGARVDSGTDNGGDFVETKFTVLVNNIPPSFVPQPNGSNVAGTQVNPQGFTTIDVAFNDPGFDNTDNLNAPAPPTITDTHHETFTHVIDWGDGIIDAVHTYADSGTHDVTITQSGPGGTQTFTVAGIGNGGSALTLVSSQNINDPSAVAQPYTYTVDWGDGNVQTITLMLKTPGNPTVNGQTFINTLARTSGTVGVPTTGSFQIMHKYLGPPDPVHPTADIKISATIVDDNDGSVSDFTTVSNPGIQTINVAIDTTPQVPRLVFIPQQSPHMLLEQQSVAPQSLQPSRARIVPSEMVTTSDRYVELVVVSLDGTEVERYRLSDEALVDLRGLFAKLPDNRYRIYLFRADNNSRRLVMDVFVRRGRVIDPSDDSEGTRDRPPTNEDTQPNKAQQNGQQNAVPLQQQQQNQPTQNNLLLKPAPADSPRGASAQPRLPANGTNQTAGKAVFDNQPTRSRTAMNWVMPLAWLGLVASPESWSRRVGAALERADDRDWQRLRRAGRLGKMATKPRQERPEVTSDAV